MADKLVQIEVGAVLVIAGGIDALRVELAVTRVGVLQQQAGGVGGERQAAGVALDAALH